MFNAEVWLPPVNKPLLLVVRDEDGRVEYLTGTRKKDWYSVSQEVVYYIYQMLPIKEGSCFELIKMRNTYTVLFWELLDEGVLREDGTY